MSNEPSAPQANVATPVTEAPARVLDARQVKSKNIVKEIKEEIAVPSKAEAPASGGPNTEGMTKEEAREAIRKHKVKVMGKELEVDEEELKRGYSHQQAANKAMQEGLKKQKQFEEILKELKNPKTIVEALKKLGHDPRKFAEEYLGGELEVEMLDPRDRKLREYESKLKQYEEMKAMEEEEKNRSHMESLKQKFAEKYTKDFTEALTKHKIPVNKRTISSIASYVQESARIAQAEGFPASSVLTVDEAAQLVQSDLAEVARTIASDADAEYLINLLGEDVANKIRKYDLSRVKDPNAGAKTPVEQGEKSTRSERNSKERMGHREWRDFNRR